MGKKYEIKQICLFVCFYFVVFVVFRSSLFETTIICFGSTKMEISTAKKMHPLGKKSGKVGPY